MDEYDKEAQAAYDALAGKNRPGRMKIFVVKVPIFNIDVATCVGCSAQEARNAFYDLEGLRSVVPVPEKSRGACCIPDDMGAEIFMWVEDPEENASVVFHELVHVALGICDLKGMQRDDELIAYLMAWLKINVADRIFFDEDEEPTPTVKKPVKCSDCLHLRVGHFSIPYCSHPNGLMIHTDPSVGVPHWCPLWVTEEPPV